MKSMRLLIVSITMLSLAGQIHAATDGWVLYEGDSIQVKKTVWRETAPDSENGSADVVTVKYLTNRRALVGKGCHIGNLASTVEVGTADVNLGAVTDEDLSNSSTFGSGLRVGTGISLFCSVKDNNNYYAKGTKAGFSVTANDGSNLLSLDIIKLFAIGFYRDGKLIKTVI